MSALSIDLNFAHSQHTATNKVSDAIIVINSKGEIVDWNEVSYRLFGWSKSEVLHKKYTDLLGAKALSKGTAIDDVLNFLDNSSKNWHGKLIQKHKQGDSIITETSIYFFRHHQPNSNYCLIINRLAFPESSEKKGEDHNSLNHKNGYFEERLLNAIILQGGEMDDLSVLTSFLLNILIKSFSLEAGGIYLLSEEHKELSLIASAHIIDSVKSQLATWPVNSFPIQHIIQDHDALYSDTLKKQLPAKHPLSTYESIVAIPFIASHTFLGAFIGFSHKRNIPHFHKPSNTRLLSHQMGLLISRLQVKNKCQKLNDEIELIIQKRTYDLTLANQQLRKYTSIIGHDLREPARMILAYLELLHRKHGELFKDEALEFLHYAMDGAERMKALLDGISEYTRITSQNRKHEPIYLQSLLLEVCTKLEKTILESNTRITFSKLPQIEGDPQLVLKLFRILLEKLILLSLGDPTAIEVSLDQSEHFWTCYIIKKGKSLREDQIHRIEQVFSKGYHIKTLPDLDLGLSICRGIVEKHGGFIGIESDSLNGTTVYFTIKKYSEAQKRMMYVD